jgi:hypothetical protein
MVSLAFKDTEWRPQFYVSTSSALGDAEWRDVMLDGAWAARHAFLWDEYSIDWPHVHSLRCSEIDHIETGDKRYWSDNIYKRVSKFGTVMFPAIQIAAYLGFAPLYLIGCDLNYTYSPGVDHNHAYPQIATPPDYMGYFESGLIDRVHSQAHVIARDACIARGIQVYNATEEGGMDTYPRRNFMEALSAYR